MSSSTAVDLLVIGSGASGMTTAARAAQAGARVLVVEKARETGGSAAISGGFVWTAAEVDALLAEDPDADASLVSALVEGFPEGIEWLRSLGLTLSEEITGIYGFGHGFRIDPNAYLDRCRSIVRISRGATAGRDADQRAQEGRRACHRRDRRCRRRAVDPQSALPRPFLPPAAFRPTPHCALDTSTPAPIECSSGRNPHSDGDGLRLGLAAGAEPTADMAGFYGHLVPSPLETFPPESFIPFAQLHSAYCLLLDEHGSRFTDESLGDHKNVQALVRHPTDKAILVADGEIHRTQVLAEYILGLPSIDRLRIAAEAGAPGLRRKGASQSSLTPWRRGEPTAPGFCAR